MHKLGSLLSRTVCFYVLLSAVTFGQGASTIRSASAGSVSADLQALYARTQTVLTEAEVTEIARTCTQVISRTDRSSTDRQYATKLFAWALNRRGEMRSEQAGNLVAKGQLAEAAKLDRLATADFKTSLEHNPDSWRAHHNYGISLAMGGAYNAAIEEFSTAISLNDEYANLYFNRGELHFELTHYELAIDDYNQAIALAPDDAQYFNSRGHCKFMLDHTTDAIQDYRRAAEIDHKNATYRTDLADACQYIGDWESAAVAYREAIGLDNKNVRAYQSAAWLMATCPDNKIRNVELALEAARRARDLETKPSSRTLDTLAVATAATGKYTEAAKLQRQAIEISSADEREELKSRLSLYEKGQSYMRDPQVRTASANGQRGSR
ncbi:MAG: tetratricopeptide repeat protein [Planctomycetales bacterium]|nr:tetratricopeptide repeat protein [Planctomycetales bacterium]